MALRRKRENRFIELLRRQAETMEEGVEALYTFVAEGDPEAAETVRRCEHDGDELRRVLVDELHKTFVTPFDREDVWNLSLYLDDVLDYAYSTVREMDLLGVKGDRHLSEMTDRLRRAAEDLRFAMERLERNPMVALDHAARVKRRENQIEKAYREAIADLFSGPEDVHHIMEMLRAREVYRHISNAADRADLAANLIGTVVVKMTYGGPVAIGRPRSGYAAPTWPDSLPSSPVPCSSSPPAAGIPSPSRMLRRRWIWPVSPPMRWPRSSRPASR